MTEVSIWTLIKCDYFNGTHFCTKKFQTSLDRKEALQEATTYGWSSTKHGIRCSKHKGVPSIRTSREEGYPTEER